MNVAKVTNVVVKRMYLLDNFFSFDFKIYFYFNSTTTLNPAVYSLDVP